MDGAGGVGALLVVVNDSENYYPSYDGNSNIVEYTDENQTSIAKFEYSPFGAVKIESGSMVDELNYRFSTKYFDKDTNLIVYRYRNYNPQTGKWQTRDPIGEEGGYNLYGYTNNESIQKYDVLGMWWSNVHFLKTMKWGVELGLTRESAFKIGTENEQVDGGAFGLEDYKSFLPVVGTQAFHFYRSANGDKDSRLKLHSLFYNLAYKACKKEELSWDANGNLYQNISNPILAAKYLGIALHPLQDWVAHGDYGLDERSGVYVTHNSRSPQSTFGGDPGDYPDMMRLDVKGSKDGRATKQFLISKTEKRPYSTTYGAIQYTTVKLPGKYAIYETGYKRITLTEKLTKNLIINSLHF